jgi:hypothetical protein
MSGQWYVPDIRRAVSDQVWFRYSQDEEGEAEVKIYTAVGALVKTISGLGDRPIGVYDSRSRAIFWDTKDTGGTPQGSGVYFADLYIDTVYYDRIKFTLP